MSDSASKFRAAPSPRVFLQRHAHRLAALSLVLMFGMLAHAALTESPTMDEPAHLICGLSYLSTGDARLSFAHPPLGNLLQGIPGFLLDRPIDVRSFPGWQNDWHVSKAALAYLGKDYERARTAIVGGRLVTAALTVLLGIYLYRFCLRWGRPRALLTVALYAFFPVFLAHGHLATTDMPATVAATIAVGEFVRWLEGRSWLRFLSFSVMTGVAFATKFNTLFLIPALGLAGLIAAIRGGGPLAGRPLWTRLAMLGRDFILVALVSIFVVNAAYGFQRTGWSVERTLAAPEPINGITLRHKGQLLEKFSALPSLPSWLPIPLPYPWIFGVHSIKAQSVQRHGGWFFGEQRFSPLYFPTLAVIKTPAAVLLLLLLGGWWAACRKRLPSNLQLALWVAPILLLGVSLFSEIQIGVRHVMPIFPFVLIGAGWAATVVALHWPVVSSLILLLAGVESVLNAPTFLGHFSWAIGGSKIGHRISMIAEDWGQDTRALAAYARTNSLEPLYYRPYSSMARRELLRFGVRSRSFNCRTRIEGPAWVAIHANQIVRWRSDCGPIARDRLPDAKVNEHIWLYRLVPDAQAPGDIVDAVARPPRK